VTLRNLKVAIIDDDGPVRTSLCFLLELYGFEVCSFESAAEFLADSNAGPIDCLVVDQCMPETTGTTLVSQLRAFGSHIPAILITGHADPGLESTAKSAGLFCVLQKPLSGDALLHAIHAAIDAGPRHQSP